MSGNSRSFFFWNYVFIGKTNTNMGKYIKLFDTHSEYLAFTQTDDFLKPNVSHCIQEDEVHYNPYDFSDRYFTTIARESGAISFNIWKSMGTDMITSMSYSTDGGETWNTTNNQENKTENLAITANVSQGDIVMWKGDASQLGFYDDDEYGDYVGSFFSSTCEFDTQGNVMSLLYGDNFKGKVTIEKDYAFCLLFSDYNDEKECKIVNANNLCLPATTLANDCYSNMFYNCTSLTTAPQLPATTLAYACYYCMFQGCTSLSTQPELPATTLTDWCYRDMFNGCTNLATAPNLPATTLAYECYANMFYGTNLLPDCSNIDFSDETILASGGLCGLFSGTKVTYDDLKRILPIGADGKPCLPARTLAIDCYANMFNGCTSLTTAPELPATTLAQSCYYSMFNGCTSLTTAPELPATTLAVNCYYNMFNGCTNLITAPQLPATAMTNGCYVSMFQGCTSLATAPQLPATTLANGCYSYMFNGCTSLTTAPELPATTLAERCYQSMFNNCTSLNYIKAMFTTTPGANYTANWVRNVASSGTFVKNSAATWNVTGSNGIPTGWTVETA